MSVFRQVTVNPPRATWRLVVTGALLLATWAGSAYYSMIQGPFEARISQGQINGSDHEVAMARFVASYDVPSLIWCTGLAVVVLLIWVPYGVRLFRYRKAAAQAAD